MDLKSITEFISQSFEDQKLSRNEAKVFRGLLNDAQLDLEQRAVLRREIFTKAKETVRHPHSREVLDWLEDLMKVMDSGNAVTKRMNESHFFPGTGSYRRLQELLKTVRSSMDICVFTITDNRVADAIIAAHERKVKIRIISDDDKSMDLGSDLEKFAEAGIPVRFDNTPDHMHHKFAIFDGRILLNGSYNWTRSASMKNHENFVVTDEVSLVKDFQNEFDKLWALYS